MLTLDLFAGTDPQVRDALRIRETVFVQEQGVPLDLEIDDYDGIAWHVLAREDDQAVATARLISLDASRVKIGRVATLPAHRGKGIASKLVRLLMEYARREGFAEAVLDSQLDAMPLYEKLGFVAEGQIFMDADIPHRRMTRKLEGI
ncbi:GNAT family N-acetyltransferase [bacterium]|nr:GNAT family N-acetyltransferase [bacterium]